MTDADLLPRADRIHCCVPFCRRTTARKGKFADCEEIICGKHWRLAPAYLRRRRTKMVRILERAVAAHDDQRAVKAWVIENKTWKRIKAAAIEIAAGIST